MYWEKLSHDQIKENIFNAINKNLNYRLNNILGVPATYLDSEEFYPDAPFLRDAPFLTSFIANPNHIGCHTLKTSQSEQIFNGTQEIERDLIRICAEEIFKGPADSQDGYVATGGTEGNVQALWIYRNYFCKKYKANLNEIAVVFSEDTHYSVSKGTNLLNLDSIILKVDENSRDIIYIEFEKKIKQAIQQNKKYFIIIINMATTMFGSVDDMDKMTNLFDKWKVKYKVHVDAAFGGFIYPFTNDNNNLHFKNLKISSIILDGHKMLQAPYGTGVFLIKKGYMKYVCTEEAKYIPGKDYTLCGSRSGANAIALWMILKIHGSQGWKDKMITINNRTTRLCQHLKELKVDFYRNPHLNIVAVRSKYVSSKLARKYYLVPDSHDAPPKWWKLVIMTHAKNAVLDNFIMDFRSQQSYLQYY